MITIVDARGKPCPQPVILTRKAILSGLPVTTIVDNDTSRHNVTRMAEKAGHSVATERREDGTYLHITQAQGEPAIVQAGGATGDGRTPSTGPLVVAIPGENLFSNLSGLRPFHNIPVYSGCCPNVLSLSSEPIFDTSDYRYGACSRRCRT